MDQVLIDVTTFSDAGAGVFVRRGKLFEAGDFPDKDFSITPDEIKAAVAAFAPVPVDLEHQSTILDGKLGNLRSIYASADGNEIFGEYEEPTWLASVLSGAERKVSLTWDRAKKTITGMALTLNPRIPDAALFTAFASYKATGNPAAFNYRTGAERDAIDPADFADPVNKLFPIRTQDEMNDAMRQIWHAADPTTVKTNILAIAERKKFTVGSYYPYSERGMSAPIPVPETTVEDYYFSEPGSESLDKNGTRFYNSSNPEENTHMSTPAGAPGAETKPQEISQSTWGRIKAFFGVTDEQIAAAQVEFSVEKSPREIALEQENARLKKADEDRKQAEFSAGVTRRAETAKAMVAALIDDLRILPADAEAVTAEFCRALDDDALTPRAVKFSVAKDGGQGADDVEMSRTQRLDALYRAKPQHKLTDEVIREFPSESYAAFARETTPQRGEQSAEFNDDDYRELLSTTEEGRRILAQRDAAKSGAQMNGAAR